MNISEPYKQMLSTPVEFTCIEIELTVEDVERILRLAALNGYVSHHMDVVGALSQPGVQVKINPRMLDGGYDYGGHTATIQYPTLTQDAANG